MDLTVGLIVWTAVCSMDWLLDCMTVEQIRSERKKGVRDWRNIDDEVKKEVVIVAEATKKGKQSKAAAGK